MKYWKEYANYKVRCGLEKHPEKDLYTHDRKMYSQTCKQKHKQIWAKCVLVFAEVTASEHSDSWENIPTRLLFFFNKFHVPAE